MGGVDVETEEDRGGGLYARRGMGNTVSELGLMWTLGSVHHLTRARWVVTFISVVDRCWPMT